MSKDMRDWPRANLGVAANMFKHMLVTGCTNSVWVWNVDKSWGAKNAMDPMLELPPGKVKESFAQQHECRGFVRVRWSMGWPTGIESHGDEIPSRNLHIFIHAVATGDVHESSPGFLDPIHPGYEGIYLWWHVEGEPTAMHWLVNFHDFQEEIGVVSWAQLCLCGLRFLTQAQLDFDTLPWLAVVRFLSRICLDLSSVMNAKINTCFLLLDIQEEKSCFHLGGFYLASSSFLYHSNQTCRSMISPLKPPGTTGRLSHPRPYPSRCRITRWSNSEACD